LAAGKAQAIIFEGNWLTPMTEKINAQQRSQRAK
jgi:hypothetical protein